jgi:hypothetical protein
MPALLLLVYWTNELFYTFNEFRRDVPLSEPYRIGFFWLRVGMMGRLAQGRDDGQIGSG